MNTRKLIISKNIYCLWFCFGFTLITAILLWSTVAGVKAADFKQIGPGGGGAELAAAIHPENDNIMFLGQDMGGIMKTTDGGQSWTHANAGLALPSATSGVYGILEIMFSPSDSSIMFASTWAGLFRSEDTGDTWEMVLPEEKDFDGYGISCSCAAVDPGGRIVLAGTGDPTPDDNVRGEGLYRSNDGGKTFTKLKNSGIPKKTIFSRILFDPTTGDQRRHVYAATSKGLFRSTDGGETFEKIEGHFEHKNVRDIAMSQNGNRKRFWLALQTKSNGSGGIYYSSDGLDWTDATGNLPLKRNKYAQYTYTLLAHPADFSTAYVAMRDTEYEYGGLYRTTDSGNTWENVTKDLTMDNLGWGFLDLYPECAAISSSAQVKLLVGAEAQPVLSIDGGDGWEQVGTTDNKDGTWTGRGVEVTVVYDIATSNTSENRLYVGYEDIGLWRSDDAGSSWKRVFSEVDPTGVEIDGISEIHVNPDNGEELYAVASSWSNGIREEDSGSVLMHSTDAGETWAYLTPKNSKKGRGCAAVNFSGTEKSRIILFAQHGGKFRRSTDGGSSWQNIKGGIPSNHRKSLFAITFDPDNPGRVYAGTNTNLGEEGSGGGLYRSDDYGITWERLDSFEYEDVLTITFAGLPRRMYVGATTYYEDDDEYAEGALLVSDDGGETFSKVLNQPFVREIISLPDNSRSLIAAAGGDYVLGKNQNAGLYQSNDNGNTWERMDLDLPYYGQLFGLLIPSWNPDSIFIATGGIGVSTTTLE